jgi:integrase
MKKLPRGIRRRPDGRFRLYVTRNGKGMQPLVSWSLLVELGVPVPTTRLQEPGIELAKAALIKLQSQILTERRTGAIEASKKNKIKDLLMLAEQDYARQGKKTWSHCKSRWDNHLKAHFADLSANGLTSDAVDNYIFARQKEGAGPATVNRETALIRRMMNLGMCTKPPKVATVPKFTHLKEPDPRTGFLEEIEYNKLREHAHELWLRALLATYYTFGFRKGELLHLRRRQVNLLDGTIELPAGATKNGRARTIVMTTEVLILVTALVEGKQPGDHVFTRDGVPVRDFRDAWERMFAAAGVEERHCHDMRRSAIRNAIRRGVDRDTAKQMSGHLTDDVFSRYNIQAVDDLREAARKIEDGAARVTAAAAAAAQTETKTGTETRMAAAEPRLQ